MRRMIDPAGQLTTAPRNQATSRTGFESLALASADEPVVATGLGEPDERCFSGWLPESNPLLAGSVTGGVAASHCGSHPHYFCHGFGVFRESVEAPW